MKKKLFGGLVALALALAPAAAANADYQNNDELHGSLDKYLVDPGETVTYTAPAGAYDANETVTHTLTGVNGHTATTASLRTDVPADTTAEFSKSAEDDGSHTFAFVMPMQAGAQYTFQALKADGSVWDTFVVKVANPTGDGNDNDNGAGAGAGGNGNGNGGGLAMTGSDIAIAGIAGSAVLLVGAGVVLMLVRRRRRTAETAAA
ncbi:hypothetical protein [Leifsonia shinshuensis]|uniref:LPXTG cell wall anchor domain-containing protein n=1 Tax=Leifsonia shinshuensis TaxID=150026 RepID=A0A7G6YFB7_9MICO|nr:hypothetical protein [Leifsonia shinshuensis]QNE37182.1 hypothetical protein F1C12_20065 [Leifsonia shinshuensis]